MRISVEPSSGLHISLTSKLKIPIHLSKLIPFSQLGFHLGRPFRTNMDDVTVGKPSQDCCNQSQGWIPYENPASVIQRSDGHDCTGLVSQQLVSLCEIMAPCGYVL
jgi:hypothetical protein